jgi:hypothetical protein
MGPAVRHREGVSHLLLSDVTLIGNQLIINAWSDRLLARMGHSKVILDTCED